MSGSLHTSRSFFNKKILSRKQHDNNCTSDHQCSTHQPFNGFILRKYQGAIEDNKDDAQAFYCNDIRDDLQCVCNVNGCSLYGDE